MSNLLYGDTETAVRDSVRALLTQRLSPQAVLGLYDEPGSARSALWTALSQELGLTALLVPEAHGGHGNGAREAAVVLEELGRRVAPVPFLTSAVIATTCLAALDDRQLLAGLAVGTSTVALCLPITAGVSTWTATLSCTADGVIRGRATSVADAADAALIVPVQGPDGLEIRAVIPHATGLMVTPVLSLDMSRPLCDVVFDEVASRRVGDTADAHAAVNQALLAGSALLASEQLGVAEWCLQTTVTYLRERYQFGRPLGSFQALKHRLADVALGITSARAVARYAADCLATADADLPIAASLAQAHCSAIAVHASEECVQLHGGIGMTWEHPAHLYLKRAKSDQLTLGTAESHRTHLAQLVALPTG